MDSQRPNDVSPEAMQARIQQARREAETLKDRIKRKKDELADTTRESPSVISRAVIVIVSVVVVGLINCLFAPIVVAAAANSVLLSLSSPRCGSAIP